MPDESQGTQTQRIDLMLPSRLDQLALVDSMARDVLSDFVMEDRDKDFVALAIHETVANAIMHGNRFDHNRFVQVSFHIEATGLQVDVEDEGPGFNPDELPDPTNPENLLKPHGRGLLFVQKFMDKVEFKAGSKGMIVRLWKSAPYRGNP